MRTVITIDNLDIEHGILLGKVDKFCYLDAGMEDETQQWLQKLELYGQYSWILMLSGKEFSIKVNGKFYVQQLFE